MSGQGCEKGQWTALTVFDVPASRWSLSGIQPGPPGSKAPIYGIWGSSQRSDDLSPCGPFTYFLVDERPWKEVDELLAQERRDTQRQR